MKFKKAVWCESRKGLGIIPALEDLQCKMAFSTKRLTIITKEMSRDREEARIQAWGHSESSWAVTATHPLAFPSMVLTNSDLLRKKNTIINFKNPVCFGQIVTARNILISMMKVIF